MSHVINVQLIEHKIQIMLFYIVLKLFKSIEFHGIIVTQMPWLSIQHHRSLSANIHTYINRFIHRSIPQPMSDLKSFNWIRFKCDSIANRIGRCTISMSKKNTMIRNNGIGARACHLFCLIFATKKRTSTEDRSWFRCSRQTI